jgi:hypothetical protein
MIKFEALSPVSQMAQTISFDTLQTHPCSHCRDPCNRFFPVRKTSQGKPCFHYRDGFAVHNPLFVILLVDLKTYFHIMQQYSLSNNLKTVTTLTKIEKKILKGKQHG